jgi:hypothetical protein
MPSLEAAGRTLPSSPVSIFAEDFSLIVRTPRRFRFNGSRRVIQVLS